MCMGFCKEQFSAFSELRDLVKILIMWGVVCSRTIMGFWCTYVALYYRPRPLLTWNYDAAYSLYCCVILYRPQDEYLYNMSTMPVDRSVNSQDFVHGGSEPRRRRSASSGLPARRWRRTASWQCRWWRVPTGMVWSDASVLRHRCLIVRPTTW